MKPRIASRTRAVLKKLDGLDVVWFGTRGTDVEPLLNFIEPVAIVSQIAPLSENGDSSIFQDCLELRSHRRVDLDRYDIDLDFTKEANGFKLNLLRQVSGPTALLAYRAAEFLASVAFTNPLVHLFAPFHLSQRQLEHKPWVERQLMRLGIPMLTWKFVRDGDVDSIKKDLGDGPLVGRTNTGAGGAGIFKFGSVDDFLRCVPNHHDGFIGMSPFLSGAIPVNVNACVYARGQVSVFAPSFQLIGVEECTWRPMGYCGNDYAAASVLPAFVHDEIQRIAVLVGRWLRQLGFLGVFGLDFLIHEGRVIVTELNPRFQGSTPLCSDISQAFGWPDPLMEHIAAYLGLDAPKGRPACSEQSREIGSCAGEVPVAHMVFHNLNSQAVRVRAHRPPEAGTGICLECIPDPSVYVDPHAMTMRAIHRHQITDDGYQLHQRVKGLCGLLDIGY
ncbi:MAG: ATP-grasp domain-containing protein [Desulfobacteraceae bacterium]|nr:ATP-grasp domain-containing protein [Desulfobacteraceae bacterium]